MMMMMMMMIDDVAGSSWCTWSINRTPNTLDRSALIYQSCIDTSLSNEDGLSSRGFSSQSINQSINQSVFVY